MGIEPVDFSGELVALEISSVLQINNTNKKTKQMRRVMRGSGELLIGLLLVVCLILFVVVQLLLPRVFIALHYYNFFKRNWVRTSNKRARGLRGSMRLRTSSTSSGCDEGNEEEGPRTNHEPRSIRIIPKGLKNTSYYLDLAFKPAKKTSERRGRVWK